MLQRFGFDNRWVMWIMRCVESARYRFKVNEDLIGPVVPSRGLRQGDPLSPYLFILCSEGLSLMLQEEQRRGHIHGCPVARGAPAITHLMFADDCLIFFKANIAEATEVKQRLRQYERASGQVINFHKSCISFSTNTAMHVKEAVSECFQVPQCDNFGKYLGLPSVVGRNRREVFKFIEQKLRHRIGTWQKKLLSRVGKETLLKSVAKALPTYTMSIYLLPNALCDNLQKIMNGYWWQSSGGESSGIHWMAWDRMTAPKGKGGLGFKLLHQFNLALLAKQGWRILTTPDALVTKVMRARYFPRTGFLQATTRNNPSYVWRSILAGQSVLKDGLGRRVKNGRSSDIWRNPWLHDTDNPYVLSIPNFHTEPDMVARLMSPDGNGWNTKLVRETFTPADADRILRTPVSSDYNDAWFWRKDFWGGYIVKSEYRLLMETGTHNGNFHVWNKLWKIKVAPKIRSFLWRCIKGIFPVQHATGKES